MATKASSDPVAQLKAQGDPARAKQSQSYFKTAPGQYGHGDKFLGNNTQQIRNLAKQHRNDGLTTIRGYLQNEFHEVRLFGVLCLVYRYEKADEATRQQIYDFYCRQRKHINNWDLVDSSAPNIVGHHLLARPRDILYDWATQRSLWIRRIAILATFTFIRHGDFRDTLRLADLLLADKEDLIHKAVGWMLREVGKRDRESLDRFLSRRYTKMPRTMLRYAIEKHPQTERRAYLRGTR